MHVFALGFCWFVDLSLVRCVAVLNVFVGVEAFCSAVSHHGHLWSDIAHRWQNMEREVR
jgi:hypothetical protein